MLLCVSVCMSVYECVALFVRRSKLLLLTKNLYLKGYKLWNVSIKDDQKFTTKTLAKKKEKMIKGCEKSSVFTNV